MFNIKNMVEVFESLFIGVIDIVLFDFYKGNVKVCMCMIV